MPRKATVKQKKVTPDVIYGNPLITKLINRSMKDGKKSIAQKQIYNALEKVSDKGKVDAIQVFLQAIENIKPVMEVRSRRVGGAAYQVPVPVRGVRRESLAIRWLIFAARSRPNSEHHTFSGKLAAEIKAAAKGEGGAVKRRQEVERVAEANRAFAHFRW